MHVNSIFQISTVGGRPFDFNESKCDVLVGSVSNMQLYANVQSSWSSALPGSTAMSLTDTVGESGWTDRSGGHSVNSGDVFIYCTSCAGGAKTPMERHRRAGHTVSLSQTFP